MHFRRSLIFKIRKKFQFSVANIFFQKVFLRPTLGHKTKTIVPGCPNNQYKYFLWIAQITDFRKMANRAWCTDRRTRSLLYLPSGRYKYWDLSYKAIEDISEWEKKCCKNSLNVKINSWIPISRQKKNPMHVKKKK